jgi:tetratricopeptide (TPR) repeat protein
MKISVILFVVACGGVAGGIVYSNHRHAAPPASPPIADSVPVQPNPAEPKAIESNPEPPAAPPTKSDTAAGIQSSSSSSAQSSNASTISPAVSQVDALLAARKDKQAMLDQLRKDGHLDDVIAELQQRMAANPNDAKIPTTLGEALLNKVRALHEAGGDNYNQVGILAMQADESFNTALKLDPKNWEAQFVKCSSMYYWPANPEMDNQVVQRLSSLIDQQEGMPSQPEFAQPYIVLGNEYQKIGKETEAAATWALGAQKFPGDPTLQQKISGNK